MRIHRSPSFGARCAVIAGLTCAIMATSVPVPAYADLSSDLASARAELEQIGTEYAAINNEISVLSTELQTTVKEIEETSGKLNAAKDELAGYTSLGYKEGGVSLTKVIVNSTSLSDMLSRLYYANKVSTAQAELINEVKELQDELEKQQSEQQTAMDNAGKRLAEQAENQARAAAVVSSLDAQLQEQLAAEAAANEALQQGMNSAQDNNAPGIGTGVGGQGGEQAETTPSNPDPVPPTSQGGGNSGGGNSGNSGNSGSGNSGSGNSGSGNGGVSTVGAAALNVALRYEGAPYAWGGDSPEEGFDCSGLTMYSYAQIGVSIPRTAGAQLAALQRRGRFTTNINELQYGDLVFFPDHVAFYVGNGNCFGARRPGVGASTTSMVYFGTFLGGGNF